MPNIQQSELYKRIFLKVQDVQVKEFDYDFAARLFKEAKQRKGHLRSLWKDLQLYCYLTNIYSFILKLIKNQIKFLDFREQKQSSDSERRSREKEN